MRRNDPYEELAFWLNSLIQGGLSALQSWNGELAELAKLVYWDQIHQARIVLQMAVDADLADIQHALALINRLAKFNTALMLRQSDQQHLRDSYAGYIRCPNGCLPQYWWYCEHDIEHRLCVWCHDKQCAHTIKPVEVDWLQEFRANPNPQLLPAPAATTEVRLAS